MPGSDNFYGISGDISPPRFLRHLSEEQRENTSIVINSLWGWPASPGMFGRQLLCESFEKRKTRQSDRTFRNKKPCPFRSGRQLPILSKSNRNCPWNWLRTLPHHNLFLPNLSKNGTKVIYSEEMQRFLQLKITNKTQTAGGLNGRRLWVFHCATRLACLGKRNDCTRIVPWVHLRAAKKDFISAAHSPASTPSATAVLGCNAKGAYRL